jgi:hypothetical protein
MLRIEIPSAGPAPLTFSKLETLNLPAPPSGVDQEINDDVILLFADEQEAVDYSLEMDRHINSLKDRHSAEYSAASAIIKAIAEDEFVQTYRHR